MTIFEETSLGRQRCLDCRELLECASGDGRPSPGDITICLYCGHLMGFTPELRLRPLTDEEIVEAAGDPRIIRHQKARLAAFAHHEKTRRKA